MDITYFMYLGVGLYAASSFKSFSFVLVTSLCILLCDWNLLGLLLKLGIDWSTTECPSLLPGIVHRRHWDLM